MARSLEKLRNIGIIAHIDAGKTTVTEHMLFYSGAKHRVGMVDKGTTDTDSDPEEQQRGITIYAACVTFPWRDVIVNLLDTPGHVDFTAEVERCLRVLDGAVVVFSAREGVEAQSETVWRQANKYRVPRLVFINKMDREGANFEGTLAQIGQRLGAQPLAIEIPLGQGPSYVADPFRGVIDLVRMRLLTFNPNDEGRTIRDEPIPDDQADRAEIWRGMLLERLYDFSNEMMELALAEQPIPEALVRKVLRQATLGMHVQPVLCGSALHGIGVQPVLDAVADYLPCPLDVPPVTGVDPHQKDRTLQRSPSGDDPLAALVFKILPAKTGDFYWLRVYSGVLKSNSRAFNPDKDAKENIAQLWQIHATKKEEQIPEAGAGDIVGVIGPRVSITGDTLCDSKEPVLLEKIAFPETVISMAIEPESTAERKKLAEVLDMLKRQDPTFRSRENEETGQTIISGMGELHLEVTKNRLLRDFGLNVKVHKPRVSYRETVAARAEVQGECHRLVAGQQLFAAVRLKIEPVAEGVLAQPVVVLRSVPSETLPEPFVQAALEELRMCGQGGGVLGGFPLSRLRLTLLGGEWREGASTDVAFRIATADAFEKALRAAGPVLLEPVMRLEINTPDEYVGDIINDLLKRRGSIQRTDQRGEYSVVEAHAPLAELFGYSSAMRSVSQGRAGCSLEPSSYEPAPPGTLE